VDRNIMQQWDELKQIASSVSFVEENDSIIWQCKYSVQSLYAVINARGVKQVFILVMWNLMSLLDCISFYG
jgi:hypothetical protein